MNSIAVICCPDSMNEIKLSGRADRFLPKWLKKIVLRFLPIVIKENYLEPLDLSISEVQFPIVYPDISTVKPAKVLKACKRIEKALIKKGIKKVVLDKGLTAFDSIKEYLNTRNVLKAFSGEKLNKLLIEEIISSVCKKIDRQVQNTSITLVIDELNGWTEKIIKNLCTKVRFLSIISLNSENFIPLADEIYRENGLVVRLGKKAGGLLKDSDFIVIFSNNPKLVNSCRYPKKAVTLSFGTVIEKKNQNGIIIQGLNFTYKDQGIKNFKWVNMPAVLEAIYEDPDIADKYEEQKKHYLSKMKEIGCIISDYEGCRGIISSREFTAFCKSLKPKVV